MYHTVTFGLCSGCSTLTVLVCPGEQEPQDPEPLYQPSEPLSKERLEAFSDGVYAIVATLLILDIWWVLLS